MFGVLGYASASRPAIRLWATAMLVLAAGCRQESAPVQLVPADLTLVRETLAEFNHGAALMERYDYAGAAKSFALVVERQPDWTAAKFNLALAQLNLMGESGAQDNLDAARQGFESILAADPKHLHARFCLGMYYQHVGDIEKTVDCFRAVYDADPDESYVGYKYAEALRSAGRQDEALPILEKVVERDPGFISAIYQLANVYNRTSQREKALPLFERFKQLQAVELTVGSYVVQASYGMAGKYYRVLAADNLPLPASPSGTTTRIVFSPETKPLGAATKAWKWRGGTIGLPGMAAADVDADGDLDLCLTATGDKGAASIWQNDGKGSFVACGEFADQAVSPCFGDVDNDGDVDLWLGRAGTDLLLLNDGKGQFAPDANAALAGPDALTHTARLFDLDSDGDLDFLALRMAKGNVPAAADSAPAACSLFSSNGDGSFTDQAAELGLELRDQAVNTFLCDDFDNDLDPDLVVFPAAGPPIAWVNSRLGKYRWLQSADSGLTVEGVRSASTGDPDKDGNRDLLVFSAAGVQLWKNDGHFRFQADQDFNTRFGALRGTGGQFADIDNDGDLDIFIADAHRRDGSRGPVLLVNSWPAGGFVDAGEADAGSLFNAIRTEGNASCVVADFTGDGRCDVLLAAIGQKPVLIENATQGGHWIELDLVGKRPQDNKSRSSNSAIGARVDVKTGTVFQQFMVGCSSGPVASPPLRIHAGLGDNPTVDWLRIIWPDASLQAEVELAADRVHSVEEISRKPSSCPYLFAWNGERFEFVADFGGVGGLGYLLAPGQYAAPDPTEYIRIPQLQPHGDEYVLQSLTPLEEVTYFDEAKLIAVDHPQNTEVYPHEMMAVGVPPPPFELFCIRADQRIDPVRAVDHRGADVTDDVRTIDRRYAGATSPDPRFVGLAEEHAVELDFGDRLAKLPAKARLVLLLHGWVEYGYSATNFAASQAGLHARAPTIEVQRDGRWVELLREVGYPAGMNHTMTVDLTGKLAPSDRLIRISSNMELYWDRIFLAQHAEQAPVKLTEVAARSADLHFRGYPREFSPDGRHPNLCDYDQVERNVGWKLMAGSYTRFGEVGELLQAADDCFVIMGHGEELTLRFPTDAFGPVPEGCRRTFLLKTDSYCKDMDLYTAFPTTVEPLPFHGMSTYPYGPDERYPENDQTRTYRRQFNTRTIRTR